LQNGSDIREIPRDSFNREIDYLRISLIDRCNLRRVYCMPLNGIRFLPKAEMLTAGEIRATVEAAMTGGVQKVPPYRWRPNAN
jgi:GTP 3',8-cyclase